MANNDLFSPFNPFSALFIYFSPLFFIVSAIDTIVKKKCAFSLVKIGQSSGVVAS